MAAHGRIAGQDGTGRGARASRNALLDGLRFAAALLIVVYHYASEGPRSLEPLSPLFERGYLATDFFLMLSGYVLGRAYGGKVAGGEVSDGAFLTRRLGRIWPAHLVMLAAFAGVVGAAGLLGLPAHHAERYQWADLLTQAALLHAWGLPGGGGWNLPTWSLSALVLCYAAFPSLWRRLGAATAGGGLFLAGLILVGLADLGVRAALGRGLYDLPFQMGVIRALPLFVLGVLTARAAELGWPAPAGARLLALTCGAGVFVLQLAGRYDGLSVTLLALLIAAAGQVRLTQGARPLNQAAQIAFALYITHIFTGMLWFNAVRAVSARFGLSEAVQWGLWSLVFPLAVGAAWAFDRLVDQPLQARLNRWLTGRRDRYPAPAPSGSGRPR